jgi:hypothetical protein
MRDIITAGCVALVLSLSLVAPAAAGPFENGLAAYNRGNCATGLRLFLPLAEQVNAAAQLNLWGMYDTGQGVSQDYPQAVTWFRKAADQGHASAQHRLRIMYYVGQGVPQEHVEAHK